MHAELMNYFKSLCIYDLYSLIHIIYMVVFLHGY